MCASLCALPAAAQDEGRATYGAPDPAKELPLEGKALTALFQDVTHRGYYDYLRKPDGEYAFSERMNADGTTLHVRDGIESAGRWRAMANVVCFTYPDMGGGCFNLYQQGNCYYAFSVEARDFVAVMVADGDTPDCAPPVA